MFSNFLKFTIILIFILVLGIFSLPKFSFKLGENEVRVDFIDNYLQSINSAIGNFRKSTGVFQSKEVTSTITFDKSDYSDSEKRVILEDYISKIKNRVLTSGFYDVKVRGAIQDSNYSVVITFPEYYSNPVKYTQWLVAKGVITFASSSQENPRTLSFQDYDIVGTINKDFLDTVGNHLTFTFDQDSLVELNSAFSENQQGRYFFMNIDGLPSYFIIEYDQFIDTNQYSVRAVQTQVVDVTTLQEINDYLNITRSYFNDKEFDQTFVVSNSVDIVNPLFKAESGVLIGASFVLVSAFLLLNSYLMFRFRGLLTFGLMFASFIVLQLSILKLIPANISIMFIAGFILTTFIAAVTNIYLISRGEDIYKESLLKVRNIASFIFVVSAIIYKLLPSMGLLSDFYGVIIVGAISLFVLTFWNYKIILIFYHNGYPKIKLKK